MTRIEIEIKQINHRPAFSNIACDWLICLMLTSHYLSFFVCFRLEDLYAAVT